MKTVLPGLLCIFLVLRLQAVRGIRCYNITHEDIKPTFPNGVNLCDSAADNQCYEIELKFDKAVKLELGCGYCPEANQRVMINGDSKGVCLQISSYRDFPNGKAANNIKLKAADAKVCEFVDDTGPRGTILCEGGQSCSTGVTHDKKMFRGCASMCKELKIVDCRECPNKTCAHPAFDAGGKNGSGMAQMGFVSLVVVAATLAIKLTGDSAL